MTIYIKEPKNSARKLVDKHFSKVARYVIDLKSVVLFYKSNKQVEKKLGKQNISQ